MLGHLQPRLIHLREKRHHLVEFRSRYYRGVLRKSSARDEDGVRLVLPLCSNILTEILRSRCNKCNHVKARMSVLPGKEK
jgi:hypothetical protein